MKQTIEFQDKKGYLRCYVAGVDSLQFSIDYFNRVAEECQQRGFDKVLIVEDLEYQLKTIEMFTLAEKLPELFRGIKIAFVDLSPEDVQENTFGENVGVNRGLFAKVCSDESSAEQWLLSS